MSENKGSTTLEVTLALLLGGVIGAGIALLYAPQTGEETRKKLKETADKLRDQFKEKGDTVSEYASEGVQKVRQFVEEKKADVTAAYEAGKEAFKKEKARL
ncbi:MAG: YtxH domain-containing protein [Deltaproteobacteria bacterium]|nr:YtxH domain-containing protein [Deltaproteobacteria bacterium]